MKKMRIILMVMLNFCMMLGAMTCEAAAKKTVAVTGVEYMDRSSVSHQASVDLDAAITSILVQSGNYNVVERAQLAHVIRELGLHSSGLIAGNTAIQFGQMVGADYTVIGNIVAATVDKFDNGLYRGTKAKIKFNFKFIDNKTGMIKISEIIEGTKSISDFENQYPDQRNMISSAATEVAEKMMVRLEEINPVTGIVVGVTEEAIYIDLGSLNGVHKGDMFVIYEEGGIIRHPVTGEILAAKEKTMGSLKVKEVYEKYSICEQKKNKGDIKDGYKVKRLHK